MKKLKKLLACLSMLMFWASSSYAYFAYHLAIVSTPHQNEDKCWRIRVTVHDVQDGEVYFVGSGVVRICHGVAGIAPPVEEPNPNCPPVTINGITYYTDLISSVCFSEILADPGLAASLEADIIDITNQNGGAQYRTSGSNSSSGTAGPALIQSKVGFKIYPNPLTSGKSLMVDIPLEMKKDIQNARLVIYDNTGKLVSFSKIAAGSAPNMVTLPSASGIYSILLEAEGKVVHAEKIVQQ